MSRRKCGCVFADASNTVSVRHGYELGGYLKHACIKYTKQKEQTNMHTVERYHDISCGHRVVGHESKCAHIHGHNYRITFVCAAQYRQIEVTGLDDPQPRFVSSDQRQPLDTVGRVIDFDVIKSRLCQWLEDQWDHKFLCWEKDDMLRALRILINDERNILMAPFYGLGVMSNDERGTFNASFVKVPFNPTAENMAQYLVDVIGPQQLDGTGVQVISCQVQETRKCSATYSKGA